MFIWFFNSYKGLQFSQAVQILCAHLSQGFSYFFIIWLLSILNHLRAMTLFPALFALCIQTTKFDPFSLCSAHRCCSFVDPFLWNEVSILILFSIVTRNLPVWHSYIVQKSEPFYSFHSIFPCGTEISVDGNLFLLQPFPIYSHATAASHMLFSNSCPCVGGIPWLFYTLYWEGSWYLWN